MSDHWITAEQYRRQAEECVAMAKAAIGNKIRAHHYATAEHYLKLAEAEAELANRSTGLLGRRLQALFRLSRSDSQKLVS
jgi:hypothetical protein